MSDPGMGDGANPRPAPPAAPNPQVDFALQEGERVLYFQRRKYSKLETIGSKGTLPLSYGITDRRLVIINGDGSISEWNLSEFDDVHGVRAQTGGGGGGLIAKVAASAIVAGLNAKAAKQEKATVEHWNRVVTIALTGPNTEGAVMGVKPFEARTMGPILAHCILYANAAQIPTWQDPLLAMQARARAPVNKLTKTIVWPYILAGVFLLGIIVPISLLTRSMGLKKDAEEGIEFVRNAVKKAPKDRNGAEAYAVKEPEERIQDHQRRLKEFEGRITIAFALIAAVGVVAIVFIILGVSLNRRRKKKLAAQSAEPAPA